MVKQIYVFDLQNRQEFIKIDAINWNIIDNNYIGKLVIDKSW